MARGIWDALHKCQLPLLSGRVSEERMREGAERVRRRDVEGVPGEPKPCVLS